VPLLLKRPSPPLRVIGIDPGSSRTGVGVVERDGTRFRCVHFEVIRVAGDLPDRLLEIHQRLTAVVAEAAAMQAAVEDLFHARNVRSVIQLAQARGVALLALACAGLPITSYAPAVVKRSVSGSGRAEKPQVAAMVTAILGLPAPPPADAADALAVALCHAMHPSVG
jgi:crossover junction endodeoxyribonuclease RuvC